MAEAHPGNIDIGVSHILELSILHEQGCRQTPSCNLPSSSLAPRSGPIQQPIGASVGIP